MYDGLCPWNMLEVFPGGFSVSNTLLPLLSSPTKHCKVNRKDHWHFTILLTVGLRGFIAGEENENWNTDDWFFIGKNWNIKSLLPNTYLILPDSQMSSCQPRSIQIERQLILILLKVWEMMKLLSYFERKCVYICDLLEKTDFLPWLFRKMESYNQKLPSTSSPYIFLLFAFLCNILLGGPCTLTN